jgi:hypothetical protein
MLFMRPYTFILALFIFLSCKGQESKREELRFKEVGWILSIPENSNLLNKKQIDSLQKATNQKLENSYGPQIDFGSTKTLFLFRNGEYNTFGSTINRYNSSGFSSWHDSYAATKSMMMDMFKAQKPNMEILDTSSGKEVIGNRKFEKFYIKTYYPSLNLTMHTYWYCRLQNAYDFSINVSYTEETVGKQFIEIIKASKFDN